MKKILTVCIVVAGLYAQQPPSWEMCGEISPTISTVYEIIETPDGSILAATDANANPTAVIWKSTDGGQTWNYVLIAPSSLYRCYDLEITPSGRIYAVVCWDYYTSDILIYYSDNNGTNWSLLPQPRIPLKVIFSTYGQINDIGLKYHNGKLYIWGPNITPPYSKGGPYHAECWFYDENTSKWGKWDLPFSYKGFAIEKGPGPVPGNTYLYLGTAFNGARVIRINEPIGILERKNSNRREK